MAERWLARVENPAGAFPELDWIDSRARVLGESFGMACRSIDDLVRDGSMIEVAMPEYGVDVERELAGEG